jgi:chromosome segregation ATPase
LQANEAQEKVGELTSELAASTDENRVLKNKIFLLNGDIDKLLRQMDELRSNVW